MGSSVTSNIGRSIGSSIGISIGSSIGISIGSSTGSSLGSNIGGSIESIMRNNVGSCIGRSIGNSVESSIGISMGSKEMVIIFFYARILDKGLLIRFFGINILCRIYCKFSKLRIVILNVLRKFLNSNTNRVRL